MLFFLSEAKTLLNENNIHKRYARDLDMLF